MKIDSMALHKQFQNINVCTTVYVIICKLNFVWRSASRLLPRHQLTGVNVICSVSEYRTTLKCYDSVDFSHLTRLIFLNENRISLCYWRGLKVAKTKQPYLRRRLSAHAYMRKCHKPIECIIFCFTDLYTFKHNQA